jgi:predicted aldo/keto reductase-like oxidoreductase
VKYRRFGKIDWQASALGFGCMRLPTKDGRPQSPDVDEAESIRLIRLSIDRGVNYVDTAYSYHNGRSEIVLGKALLDGYRSRVFLATKSPVWSITRSEDFDKFLNEQLGRLGTDRIDGYLFHALNRKRWKDIVLRFGLLERAEAAVRDGRIGVVGFSFHDTTEAFSEILDGYGGWGLCQIQYNYMDVENQAGRSGLKRAAEKGLAAVIMEPLLGGRLAAPPASVLEAFDQFPVKRSPADWALQWLWDQPEVSVVLSGMNSLSQVKENIRSAEESAPGSFGPAEHDLIDRIRSCFRTRAAIPCTKCGYCLPCPNGVDILRNIELYNDGAMYEDLKIPRQIYNRILAEKERASACERCLTCQEKCPQNIEISEWMAVIQAALGEEKSPGGK